MTNQSVDKPQNIDVDNIPPRVSKQSVGEYLLSNPSFLIENPDLLLQLQLTLKENGVVSLTEIQTSQYREKIKQLKSQLDGLLETARKNELIYTTYAQLNLDMAKANSLTELHSTIQHHFVNSLDLETSQLLLLEDSELGSACKFSEIQHHSIFDKKLAKQPYYFGRVGKLDKEAIFPDYRAGSVALVLIRNETTDKPLGLLAISSKNESHFYPEMDTVLVEFLRKNLDFHVTRLLCIQTE